MKAKQISTPNIKVLSELCMLNFINISWILIGKRRSTPKILSLALFRLKGNVK